MKNKYSKKIIHLLKIKKIVIKDNEDLFTNDKIDSFGFIELMFNIEKKYKIKLNHKKIFMKKKLTISDLSTIIEKSDNRKIKKK